MTQGQVTILLFLAGIVAVAAVWDIATKALTFFGF